MGLLTKQSADDCSRVDADVCLCLPSNPDSFGQDLTLSNFVFSLRKGLFDRRTSTQVNFLHSWAAR